MKSRIVLVVCLFLAGCISTPNLWGAAPLSIHVATATLSPTATAVFTSSPTVTIIPTVTVVPTITPFPTITSTRVVTLDFPTAPVAEGARHVLIISYDGMRPDAIVAAPMPNLLKLIETGAYTLNTARTVAYPATLPSHASMLSGMCMSKHGIIYDKYYKFMGYSKGVDLFDLAHVAGMKTVMIVSKDKLRQLAEPETTDVFEIHYGESAVAKAAVEQISSGFDLMFVHFAGPDLRGHKYGWMSGEYLKVLRQGDVALGNILAALDDNGLRDNTLIIVTADHGGHDKNHIGLVLEDYLIPWIAAGPGVVHLELNTPIQQMDTAATAAYFLNLPIPAEWDGFPVYEAFGLPAQQVHDENTCK